jgi:hypothetical protein
MCLCAAGCLVLVAEVDENRCGNMSCHRSSIYMAGSGSGTGIDQYGGDGDTHSL